MKMLVAAILCLLSATAGARAPQHHFDRFIISGSEYIRLDDWASAFHYNVRWNRHDGVVALNNAVTPLTFTVDSRRAEIDGVNVWLSLPIINRNGQPLVSLLDTRTTLEPILFPHKGDGIVRTVCLDPGHGGKDPGNIDHHNFEKSFALLLAQDVAAMLKHEGLHVLLTRNSDSFVDLSARPLLARREGADLFVSLHYNSAERGIRGVEVYCLAPEGVNSSNDGGGRSARGREPGNIQDDHNALLAYQMEKSITGSVALEDRGVKRSHFEVLRESSMPAILIEGGFMTNAAEAKNIYDSVFRQRMAHAIVNGILAYRRLVQPA